MRIAIVGLFLSSVCGYSPTGGCAPSAWIGPVRTIHPLCSAVQPPAEDDASAAADALLVAATGALREGEPSRAAELIAQARERYSADLPPEREQLLQMVQSRVDDALSQQPTAGPTAPPTDSPPASASASAAASAVASAAPTLDVVQEAQRQQHQAARAAAARLTSELGPVAWDPRDGSDSQKEAAKAGDAAVSESVGALGRKDFELAFAKLEEAKAAFRTAGPQYERARAMTIENLYGYVRAERERRVRLFVLFGEEGAGKERIRRERVWALHRTRLRHGDTHASRTLCSSTYSRLGHLF